MGDTLGFVSPYSHAWEWTISTIGLMTVRASSAHGTGKKKNDSSLVGPRPFSLPLFHPARALCVVFVALRCHLRYWLGFYLN